MISPTKNNKCQLNLFYLQNFGRSSTDVGGFTVGFPNGMILKISSSMSSCAFFPQVFLAGSALAVVKMVSAARRSRRTV